MMKYIYKTFYTILCIGVGIGADANAQSRPSGHSQGASITKTQSSFPQTHKEQSLFYSTNLEETTSSDNLLLGAKAGLNIANFQTNDLSVEEPLYAYYLGAYVHAEILPRLQLQTELLYTLTGATVAIYTPPEEGDDPAIPSAAEIELAYLAIPVVCQYQLKEQWKIHIGAQYAMLLSHSFDAEGDDADGFFEKSTGALLFGTSFQATEALWLELRYQMGLTELFSSAAAFKAKNKVFQIGVAYDLPFFK